MAKRFNDTFDYDDLEEALVRFKRGDMLMCMFYLDKAGFTGIEALWGVR